MFEVIQKEVKKVLDWALIWTEAYAAGIESMSKCTPIPMTVVDSSREYFVPDGVCGFAWIVVGGRHPFAIWCRKHKETSKNYYGGTTVYWVSEGGQSMQKKMAFAQGFVKVLKSYDIPARSHSQID